MQNPPPRGIKRRLRVTLSQATIGTPKDPQALPYLYYWYDSGGRVGMPCPFAISLLVYVDAVDHGRVEVNQCGAEFVVC